MAEPLKYVYNRAYFDQLLDDFEAVGHPLNRQAFFKQIFIHTIRRMRPLQKRRRKVGNASSWCAEL